MYMYICIYPSIYLSIYIYIYIYLYIYISIYIYMYTYLFKALTPNPCAVEAVPCRTRAPLRLYPRAPWVTRPGDNIKANLTSQSGQPLRIPPASRGIPGRVHFQEVPLALMLSPGWLWGYRPM